MIKDLKHNGEKFYIEFYHEELTQTMINEKTLNVVINTNEFYKNINTLNDAKQITNIIKQHFKRMTGPDAMKLKILLQYLLVLHVVLKLLNLHMFLNH